MKKLYFTLLSILSGLAFVTAQTLTVTNHAPTVGDIIKTTDASTAGVLPGGNGAGQNWNYSSITIGSANMTYSVVTAASTGSLSSFGSSSVSVSTGTTNSFYSSSPTEHKYWGGNLVLGGLNAILTYTSAAVYAKYPMSLNTNTTATVGGTLTAASNNGSFNGTSTVSASGTGTLQLPGRTFNNVIKVTTTQILYYSVSVITGTVVQVVNEYYDPMLSKAPLFTINQSTIASIVVMPPVQTSTQVATFVNTDYMMVGVKEQSKEISNLNIYPNPSKSNFNISLTNENAEVISYEMINVLGQSVRKETLGNNKGEVKYNIETSGIEAGVYFVKVNAGNATSVKKITIQ